MLDSNLPIDYIFAWSRHNCIAICGFLVPANIIATLQTMIFTGMRSPVSQIRTITVVAFLYAGAMILHVFSWFVVGVVMLPTFILLFLSTVCLGINIWAIANLPQMSGFMRLIWQTIVYLFSRAKIVAAGESHPDNPRVFIP